MIVVLSLAYTAPTHADPGNWYLGGGPAFSFLEPDTNADPVLSVDDDTDIGGKIFLGYDITKHWSLEGFFGIPGEAGLAPSGSVDYDALYGLGALYSWPHNGQGLSGFLKGGGVGLNTDTSTGIDNYQENAGQIFAGGGAQYNFANNWSGRLEYEYFFSDVQMITLSVIRRFGIGGGKQEPAAAPVEPAPAAIAQPEPAETVAAQVLDSDNDGVDNTQDACPGTLQGVRVDANGCPVFDGALPGVQFNYNSASVTSAAANRLDEVARALKRHPGLRIEVQGHTCNIGGPAYNQKLSERRSQSVANYLIGQGIAADRIATRGFGKTQPIASNANEAGRSQNRRCEIVVTDP